MNLLRQIPLPGWTGIIEILVLAALFYYIILFFRGTRGAAVLSGFAVLLFALLALTHFFHLDALNWIIQRFSVYLAVAFLVIFQPEIRRALAELGKQHVFASTRTERSLVDHVVKAAFLLSERKIGALIALEREIGTRAIQETGTRIDSSVSPELLASIFYPHTPLHDGGVIIRDDRILAAGCVFPLSSRHVLSKSLGMRHRAAVGMTEETDAIVVIVSEETGAVSLSYKGRLSRGLSEERLRRFLSAVLIKSKQAKSRLSRVKEQLDLTPEGVAKTEEKKVEELEDHV
ncbi:MAG: diadenylate cyclase CdaA [Verrucomicrobia bacterium]|nr:diadenylate cyclase CdaA [Verrucomicrobiota bacterium]